MWGNSVYCWNTVLTLRWWGATLDTSTPSSITLPLVGCSKPAIIFSRVVLPQPDGPRSEKNSPRAIREVGPLDRDEVPELLADPLKHDHVVVQDRHLPCSSARADRIVGRQN